MRYNDKHILEELERAIAQAGSLRKLGEATGISPSYLSEVRRGIAPPSAAVAAHLGYIEDGNRWVDKKNG